MEWKFWNKPSVAAPLPKFDWLLDSGFLTWAVDKKVADFRDLVIRPKVENNDRAIPINDTAIEGFVKQAATDILEMLSSTYKEGLGRYVSEASVPVLVVDMLFSRILALGIEANRVKLRRLRMLGVPENADDTSERKEGI